MSRRTLPSTRARHSTMPPAMMAPCVRAERRANDCRSTPGAALGRRANIAAVKRAPITRPPRCHCQEMLGMEKVYTRLRPVSYEILAVYMHIRLLQHNTTSHEL